jgi:hypothetical protein
MPTRKSIYSDYNLECQIITLHPPHITAWERTHNLSDW